MNLLAAGRGCSSPQLVQLRCCRFVLISVGTTVAYVYSVFAVIYGRVVSGPDYRAVEFFETSALLITFIALGKLLEGTAKGRTSKVCL